MTLTVRLERLPDLDNDQAVAQHDFAAYGRFGVTRNGSFFFSGVRSSHPQDCAVGWYWAIREEGILLVSARGAKIDGEALFQERKPILARLIEELVATGVIRKPTGIRVE